MNYSIVAQLQGVKMSTVVYAVACRWGADGATAPAIQRGGGIQRPNFVKKMVFDF